MRNSAESYESGRLEWPSVRNGEKMAQNGEKNGIFGVVFLFVRHFWAIFPHFEPRAIFYFFCQFFPIFGFRPVFHSIPGGLTRKQRGTILGTGQATLEQT